MLLSYNYTPWWTNIAIENGHRNSEFSHLKWWFSIAMLVHQRVMMCHYMVIIVGRNIEKWCHQRELYRISKIKVGSSSTKHVISATEKMGMWATTIRDLLGFHDESYMRQQHPTTMLMRHASNKSAKKIGSVTLCDIVRPQSTIIRWRKLPFCGGILLEHAQVSMI